MNDLIFVNGVKVKQKFDGLLGVSIKLEDFEKFAQTYKNKGYLNIDICRSKDKKDVWYARLNTWKPNNNDSDEIVKWSD